MAVDQENRTPARPPPTLKKQSSSATSNGKQSSILGFFGKSVGTNVAPPRGTQNALSTANGNGASSTAKTSPSLPKPRVNGSAFKVPSFAKKDIDRTPVPSSDVPLPEDDDVLMTGMTSSPTRKAKKVISYKESDDEEDDIVPTQRRRPVKKVVESEDEFGEDLFDDDDG